MVRLTPFIVAVLLGPSYYHHVALAALTTTDSLRDDEGTGNSRSRGVPSHVKKKNVASGTDPRDILDQVKDASTLFDPSMYTSEEVIPPIPSEPVDLDDEPVKGHENHEEEDDHHFSNDSPSNQTHSNGLLRGSSSSRTSSSSKNTREEEEMLPLDVFAMEHGFKKGSTLSLYLLDKTESHIFVNNKMYSLVDGLEEQEMTESSSSLTGVGRKFIGQNDDNDTITMIKDMEGNIQSIDIMTDDHYDGNKNAVFHLVAFEKNVMVMVNPEDSIDTNDNLKHKMQLQTTGWCYLCRHFNCQGGSVWKTPGWYASMPWQIGDNQLSFVFIDKGTGFRYWEHRNWQGWNRMFQAWNYNIHLNMGGHNDSVSSYVIWKL